MLNALSSAILALSHGFARVRFDGNEHFGTKGGFGESTKDAALE